jgi:hypothetical protein
VIGGKRLWLWRAVDSVSSGSTDFIASPCSARRRAGVTSGGAARVFTFNGDKVQEATALGVDV